MFIYRLCQQKFEAPDVGAKESLNTTQDSLVSVASQSSIDVSALDKIAMYPLILDQCLTYLSMNDRDTEGIFRVPGNSRHVQNIMEHFEGNPVDTSEDNALSRYITSSGYTGHDVASFTKKCISKVSGARGLIPSNCSSALIGIFFDGKQIKTPHQNPVSTIRVIIRSLLDQKSLAVLKRLAIFLHEFTKYEAETKMGPLQLGICFSHLLQDKPKRENFSMEKLNKLTNVELGIYLAHMKMLSRVKCAVMTAVITNAREIFGD